MLLVLVLRVARASVATQRRVGVFEWRSRVSACLVASARHRLLATAPQDGEGDGFQGGDDATGRWGGEQHREFAGDVGLDTDGYDFGTSAAHQRLPQQEQLHQQQQQQQQHHDLGGDDTDYSDEAARYADGRDARRPLYRGRRRPLEGKDGHSSRAEEAGVGARPHGERGRRAERRTSGQNGKKYAHPSKEYVNLLGNLKQTGNWMKIIHTYKEASEKPGFNVVMFNATIAALSQGPKWRVALSIFGEMREAGLAPDAYSFNSAIQACVKGRKEELAFSLFHEMPAAGVSPDLYTYNHLISSCKPEGKWETALSLARDMEAAGLKRSSMSYNATIVACGNGGQADLAVGLLDEMRANRVALTEGSYSAAIAACGKVGKWERSLVLLEEMKKGADNLEPNEVCYISAICACQKSARWREALSLLREMQSAELTVAGPTYNHVIKACIHAGEVSQAEALMEEMRAAGIHVKSGVAAMVEKRAAQRRGRGSWTELLGASATTAPYEGVEAPAPDGRHARAAVQNGPVSDNTDVVAGWPRVHSPDRDAGRTVAGARDTWPIASLYGTARNSPRRTSVRLFLRAVGEHTKRRRWSYIVRELEAATADPGVKVSMSMYHGCLAGLSTGGKWAEAIDVLEKMHEAGLAVDSRCVTAAIRACAKAQPPRWGMAVSLLRGLKEPQVWAYVATLSALANAGQWKASVSVLEEMRPAGVEPNLYCYNSTLAAFRMADPPQWQKACAMVARIKEEGMEPDLVSYSTAVQACLAASETGAAESLMNDMIQAGCVPVEDLKRVLLQRP